MSTDLVLEPTLARVRENLAPGAPQTASAAGSGVAGAGPRHRTGAAGGCFRGWSSARGCPVLLPSTQSTQSTHRRCLSETANR